MLILNKHQTGPEPPKVAINHNLEALRGLAALVVVFHHIIYHKYQLDPGYAPTGIAAYNPPGHFAVLIFFLLSGYVIGARYSQPLKKHEVGEYLRKRVVRLYPMYVLALLAGVVAAGFTVSLTTIFHYLAFLQYLFSPGIFENNPLWSLQYEVLFYLLFIPLSLSKVRAWWVVAVCLTASMGILVLNTNSTGVEPYLFGFTFWAVGWALSSIPVANRPIVWQSVASALLLLLSVEYLNPLATVADKALYWLSGQGVNIRSFQDLSIKPSDFAALPYAVLIVLIIGGVQNCYVQWGRWVLQILPLVGVFHLIRHWGEPRIEEFLLPSLFYVLSTVLLLFRKQALADGCKRVVTAFIQLGAISYGLYVIHFPVLSLFHQVHVFTGTSLTFTLRVLVYLPLALLAAYLLDKVFQPWAKRHLFRG